MIKVYGFGRVNEVAYGNTRDLRVLWALEELGLPYAIEGLAHPEEVKSAAYHAVNPFEQIPAIDDAGVTVTESGAIVMYLARKAGKLLPEDDAGWSQVARWSFAALNSVEPPLLFSWLLAGPAKKDAAVAKQHDWMLGWAKMRLAALEEWMDGRAYVATDTFTVADILMAHVLTQVKDPAIAAEFPRLMAYRGRCLSRPAWKTAFAAYEARVEAG